MNYASEAELCFGRVRDCLAGCVGEERARTIEEIQRLCGLPNRRATEELLEAKLGNFPWPLVSSSRGYYIPRTAADINHYIRSLRARALKIFIRRRTVCRQAAKAGWRRAGREFECPPQQAELRLSV